MASQLYNDRKLPCVAYLYFNGWWQMSRGTLGVPQLPERWLLFRACWDCGLCCKIIQNKPWNKVSLANISLQYSAFQVPWGGWRLTKTVITGYYKAVNLTKMQRWRGVSGIHGNHGDKVLGCSPSPLSKALVNQWHVTLAATCLTSTAVSRHLWSTHVDPDKHNWLGHDERFG